MLGVAKRIGGLWGEVMEGIREANAEASALRDAERKALVERMRREEAAYHTKFLEKAETVEEIAAVVAEHYATGGGAHGCARVDWGHRAAMREGLAKLVRAAVAEAQRDGPTGGSPL